MRLSIVVSVQPAVFSAVAYKGRLAETLADIRRLDYEGAELAVRDPGTVDLEALRNELSLLGLEVPAIGTGQAYGEEGLSLTHPDAEVRRRAVERLTAHMHFACALHALVIVGLIRGRSSKEVSETQACAWLADGLRQCIAAQPSVRVAIEPINRYETDLLNSVEAGLRFLDTLAADKAGLLLDTFHMNIEEASPLRSIEAAGTRLFHVHAADSNRRHPGAGHIDFARIIDALERAGYEGYVSAEILPYPDPDTAAGNTIRHLRQFLPARHGRLRQEQRQWTEAAARLRTDQMFARGRTGAKE